MVSGREEEVEKQSSNFDHVHYYAHSSLAVGTWKLPYYSKIKLSNALLPW